MFTLMWPHLLKSLSLSWSLYSNPGPCRGTWEWSPCPGPGLWHPSPGPGPWWKVLVYIAVNKKFTSRWNRRTLPLEPCCRCKTARFSIFQSPISLETRDFFGASWLFYCCAFCVYLFSEELLVDNIYGSSKNNTYKLKFYYKA